MLRGLGVYCSMGSIIQPLTVHRERRPLSTFPDCSSCVVSASQLFCVPFWVMKKSLFWSLNVLYFVCGTYYYTIYPPLFTLLSPANPPCPSMDFLLTTWSARDWSSLFTPVLNAVLLLLTNASVISIVLLLQLFFADMTYSPPPNTAAYAGVVG